MALIEITNKHSNLRLKFEHPIVLNPEKKFKLGVSRLMLSFDRKFAINLHFDFFTPIPDTNTSFNAKSVITGVYTINSLQKKLQKLCDEKFALLIEKNIKNKKPDINQK